MRKKYSLNISAVHGIALIFSMILYFVSAWLGGFLDMKPGSLLIKILLELPVFLLPMAYILFLCKKKSLPVPRLSRSLNYNESAMLTVSSFGAIVLMQVLYGSVFPSTFVTLGVAETDSVFGFLLLFFGAVVLPAILEESFFRGVILRTLTVYRALLAILISSVVSALMTFSIEGFPLAFFCGFLLGSVYIATGSLGAVIGVHLSANALWFLAETIEVCMPEQYDLFLRISVISSVLLLAFGLPFLKKTVQAILADEHDEAVLPSSQFWSIPISVFLVAAILMQVFGGPV